MITDARALETAYVPQDLEHRDGQIDQLARTLRPITAGVSGYHSLIYGPSGSGKTTLAKYVVRMLRQEAFDVRGAYWNCMSGSSKTEVLYGLAQDCEVGTRLPREGTSGGVFIDAFRAVDAQLVAIVDEVDVLEDETLLLGLGDLPNVTLVTITIEKDDFFADRELDGRLKSRLTSGEVIQLQRYTSDELVDILLARIDAGLRPGVIDVDVVEHIADKAAGDARRAIKYLAKAVKHAMSDDRSKITIGDVDASRADADDELHRETVSTLGTHKRLLYDIVAEAGEISASDLHAGYEDWCSNPKARRTRRRYLRSLVEKYGLLRSSGEGKGKRYSVASA